MSDDIAAELLATAKLYDDAGVDGSAGADMCRAAAAEIARLRAEVARYRETLHRVAEICHEIEAGDASGYEALDEIRAALEGGE